MINIDIFKKLDYFDLNVDINLNREVLVLKGNSGSGKTTILDCIAGIKTPDKGLIKLNDNTLFSFHEKINIPIKNRNIGYVFQNYALFPHMNVKENILFGIKCKNIKNEDYIKYIMDTFKIAHLQNKFPKNISGGEKQRVALARALVIKPKLLLMDEPFCALDFDTKSIVYEEFKNLKKKFDISIILVTHDEKEANLLGDRIVRIKNGKIDC